MDTMQEEHSLKLSKMRYRDRFGSLPGNGLLISKLPQVDENERGESASTPEESQPLYTHPENPNELVPPPRTHEFNSQEHLGSSSRRGSAIIAALRRPSQAIALSAAHAVMAQRKYFMTLFQSHSDRSLHDDENKKQTDREILRNRRLGDDALTKILSALYAKLLVVLGMAFPITEIISPNVRPFFYQGFYLYLYLGSILFVAYMYGSLIKEKAVSSAVKSYHKDAKTDSTVLEKKIDEQSNHHPIRYGSFYLRLGAIAFGIGSMVYSGLEFGRYFELKSNDHCHSNLLNAITPATRMCLTLLQIQFIFLNSKDVQIGRHHIVSRFGLMHMIATNLCEWLYVLVEETKHEIVHFEERHNNTKHGKFCFEGHVMGSLVQNASPFLFPCKIEYSLICAVILFEMWKEIKANTKESKDASSQSGINNDVRSPGHHGHFNWHLFGSAMQSHHHFSVDCSKAHKGLFSGILVIVLTIISLIMFFVLTSYPGAKEEKSVYLNNAEIEVQVVELILYIISIITVVMAMIKMRPMKYCRKTHDGHSSLGLDNTLLVVAQTGMFIYCMFSIIGCYFNTAHNSTMGLVVEAFSFIQTCLQTIFVLDGWWRRCRNLEQARKKPGRELVTFLIISNMAMWIVNVLVKNRAEFRPTHLQFYGEWAWTIITHISMPLAIFYRFHSTICLFEIWKSAFKLKPPYKHPLLPFI
ncbi:proton channel OtopLc-like isoform X3 [Agrilus planipennis]|uniref:Proton channel OtopLc-like isoform X3 n=1 Tax=Agrilus planipennis TaxID=224129 RepID=A0A7F5R777_AGRPL|nr:proton channel OtopLc-like isoform X3 [Agrilus planipennis]